MIFQGDRTDVSAVSKVMVHACSADSGVARDQEFVSSTESDAIDGSNTRLKPSFDELNTLNPLMSVVYNKNR